MPRLPLALQLAPAADGTGLEWMPVASVVVPLLLLLLIVWFGSRNTV